MKRACTSICLLVLFFGFGSVAMSASYNSQEKEYWLFVGNPGAGKSTIINSLLKQIVAEAGSSDEGGGVTKKCALYQNVNVVYIDTPGLDDVDTRADAAKEIETALKQDGKYRIFFAVKSNGLRINPADLTTMEIILDAINLTNIEYNILVTQFTERDNTKFESNPYASASYCSRLQPGKYLNKKIRFLDMNVDVLQGKSELLNMDDFLKFTKLNSASIYLPKNSIGTVNGQSWDEKLKDIKTKLKTAQNNIDKEKEKLKDALDKLEELKKEIKEEKETDWAKIAITTFTVAVTVVEVVTTVAPFL